MIPVIDMEAVVKELKFQTVRSGGKGGQHVNKVSSKVELYFSINDSQCFTEEEKERLRIKLANRMSQDGVLKLSCEEDRSQLRNKEKVVEKLRIVLEDALKVAKKRKKTRPSLASVEKRIEKKVKHSMKKRNRSNNFDF